MEARSKKILLLAACICSCAFCFAAWRRYRPLEGTGVRYEIAENGTVFKRHWFQTAPLTSATLRRIEPEPPYAQIWCAVSANDDENEGVVLFRDDGQPSAFLPCTHAQTVTAVSASPTGRVVALIKNARVEIEFFALPERRTLGTISAFGPVLWDGPASGKAFARDGRKISFTMEPESNSNPTQRHEDTKTQRN